MIKKISLILILFLACSTSAAPRSTATAQKPAEPIVVPFELITRHILIKVKINGAGPFWFIFDTGDKVAIIDLDRAKSLGLSLQGEVNIGGAGAGTVKGATVRGASVTVVGIESKPEPLMLAIPLARLSPRFGHQID